MSTPVRSSSSMNICFIYCLICPLHIQIRQIILKLIYTIRKGRKSMSPTDAVRRATKKYLSEKVDSLTIRVPKGTKGVLESIAAGKGLSVNAYLNTVIHDVIQQEKDNA